ncbi:UNVERIFIED_CONTAM: hypothetical protein FKN15_046064 [Acipenser sinensis]
MEAEVEFYRGSVEREKRLLVDLQTLNMHLEQYKATSEQQSESLKVVGTELAGKQTELETVIGDVSIIRNKLKEAEHQSQMFSLKVVGTELAGKQTELETVIGDVSIIRNKLKEAEHQSQMFRSKYQEQISALKKTLGFLQLMKKELTRVRGAVSEFSDIQRGFSTELLNRSRDAHAEITTLHESLGTSQTQITCLREQVRDLQSVAAAAELKDQQLQTLVHGESQLQNKCHEMQKQTLDLNNQLKTLQLRLQKGTSEVEHYKQLFRSISNENEDNLSRLRRHESERKEAESRRCEELRVKEEEWLACNQKCKYLQEQLSEKERKEEEISRRNSRSENENETLKTALKQAEEEISTLKQERRCEELRVKEEEWLACNQKCKYLQEQLSEKERKEEEISRRNSRSENENETLKTALKQAEEEISTLKQERELTMLSHQSTIEQLRESFRQEMVERDSWGSKVQCLPASLVSILINFESLHTAVPNFLTRANNFLIHSSPQLALTCLLHDSFVFQTD